MRLNRKKAMEIMGSKSITEEMICMRTGLWEKSLQWILNNGFASEEAMERIADAMGVGVGEVQQCRECD